MPRSEEELLELIYRRSAAIQRRRTVRRGVSAFLSVALVGGLATPFALRGGPGAPDVRPKPPLALPEKRDGSPPPASQSPCSCTVPPREGAGPGPRRDPRPSGPGPGPRVAPESVLAFSSDRDGNWEIYRMNADGSGVSRLTDDPAPDRDPAWSPDGKRIAFVRLANIGDLVGDIYVANADGSGARLLTKKGGGPQWSPDGQQIAFQRYRLGSSGPLFGDVWVIGADGSNERSVASDGMDAAWTPDGRHLVFGGVNYEGVTNVTAVALDGSGRRQVTHNPVYACQPAVSPDGSVIAYIAAAPDGNTFHLARIDWSGATAPRMLTSGGPRLEASPTWSPDGTMIAVERDVDGDPHYASMFGNLEAQPEPAAIFLVRSDGSGEVRLTRNDARYSDADPAFMPRAP